ncbi:Uncharacterized membrane protein [Devosia enhydra]|uniref:Uncharacterized membrane protein n=1 Tax=Devosia enhydra TaxID=665118 RepID=A0A1K2HW60_9HYPH|nr:DUF1003 domain-containing protein [Devosia enhydra]SFZ82815.1 Uncharacterized membrane protein [Devosia enhydra]
MSDGESEHLGRAAGRYFGKAAESLNPTERHVLEKALGRRPLARDATADFDQKLSLGDRLSDGVAAFGGSWRFLIGFGVLLMVWTGGNLALRGAGFDPYPFIFLNLILSMLAAVQAPVIMMSQNRQAAKDRLVSQHDYAVNLKAEIEIMALHEKLDAMRNAELKALVERQDEQIALLTKLVGDKLRGPESN